MAVPKEYPMTAYVTHLKDGKIKFYSIGFRYWGAQLRTDTSNIEARLPGWDVDFAIASVDVAIHHNMTKNNFTNHDIYVVSMNPDPAHGKAIVLQAARVKTEEMDSQVLALYQLIETLEG